MRPIIFILISFATHSWGQDTIRTKYPGTSQEWLKIFQDKKKIKEAVFYASGQEWMTAKYEKGVEDWRWYHENGNPFFEAKIIDDKIEGPYKIWYENGQLAEEIYFINNLENGPAKFYHSNGQLAMVGEYAAGRMTGQWSFLTDNGERASGKWVWPFAALQERKRMQGQVANGEPIGTWEYVTTAAGSSDQYQRFKTEIK
ncbi:MAG: toxin-antitoxin system YwqK family antitoxin [Fulvivirga sp.]